MSLLRSTPCRLLQRLDAFGVLPRRLPEQSLLAKMIHERLTSAPSLRVPPSA